MKKSALQETRRLKADFVVLKERLIKKLKMLHTQERAKLIMNSFPLNILSMFNNGFESMMPDEMFGWQYLGSKLKWYQPSDLTKLAEELGCEFEFIEYVKKLCSYLRGRSLVQSNCVIIDEEWNRKIYEQGFKNAPDLVHLLESIEYEVSSSSGFKIIMCS